VTGPVDLRPATAADCARLRELLAAAKGWWGYDPAVVAEWAASIDMAATLRDREVWVAQGAGRVVAWAGLLPPDGDVAVLDDLWVDPAWMGRGIGSALFRRAAERAAALGARRMEWEAEPHALGFYRKMGGRRLRETVGEWGRPLDVMGVDLGGR
jgi:GNAT superfamily N-acetyltransferase